MQSNLRELVFEPIKKRVIQQKDSLDKLNHLKSSIGFEGWLKVEAIYALNSLVEKVGNKGSDLILKNGLPTIELKASTDNLNKNYFTNSDNEFYLDPVLFIAGKGGKTLKQLSDEKSLTIIGEENINDRLMIGFVKKVSEKVEQSLPAERKKPRPLKIAISGASRRLSGREMLRH